MPRRCFPVSVCPTVHFHREAYAGHQFGGFTMLGDGREILVGEQCRTLAVSCSTFNSRVRERLLSHAAGMARPRWVRTARVRISEAMHALGIPTTRSLAVVTTGEPVYRDRALRGAVLTRVASSHVRVGTFQFLAARQDNESLRALADYTIARHDPDLLEKPPLRYLKWLRTVMDRQASLIAQWQLVGFIHGVMNTDNVALSGETIDYGPCAFMDTYHPGTVFSSIDYGGRYAYGDQPAIGQWNVARFAETLLPLLDPDQNTAVEMATEILHEYPAVFGAIGVRACGRLACKRVEHGPPT